MTVTTLTFDDYRKAAADLGVPVAAIRAVASVETKGSGYLADNIRPVILFERHIMRKRINENLDARAGRDPVRRPGHREHGGRRIQGWRRGVGPPRAGHRH
jgi:hypothetical protein